MISPELKVRGIAAWSAEARGLHALADRWASIDLDLAESSGYRKAARRAEQIADEWRAYPVNPPTSPRRSQPKGITMSRSGRSDEERERAWQANVAAKRKLHRAQRTIAEGLAWFEGRTVPDRADWAYAADRTAGWSRRLWNW
jgi:hypothetical protein